MSDARLLIVGDASSCRSDRSDQHGKDSSSVSKLARWWSLPNRNLRQEQAGEDTRKWAKRVSARHVLRARSRSRWTLEWRKQKQCRCVAHYSEQTCRIPVRVGFQWLSECLCIF